MVGDLFNFIAGQEWIFVIIIAAVFIFGAKKIPELANGLGKGLKEFQKTTNEIKDEVNAAAEDVKSSVDERKSN